MKALRKSARWALILSPMTMKSCRALATPPFFCAYVFPSASFCKNDWIRLQLTVPLPFFCFAVGVIPREPAGFGWLATEDLKVYGVHFTTLFTLKMTAATTERVKSIRNTTRGRAAANI